MVVWVVIRWGYEVLLVVNYLLYGMENVVKFEGCNSFNFIELIRY